jgi:hypothetical protein
MSEKGTPQYSNAHSLNSSTNIKKWDIIARRHDEAIFMLTQSAKRCNVSCYDKRLLKLNRLLRRASSQ